MGKIAICPRCERERELTLHHILPRKYGGYDEETIYLCNKCHDYVEEKTYELLSSGYSFDTNTIKCFIFGGFPNLPHKNVETNGETKEDDMEVLYSNIPEFWVDKVRKRLYIFLYNNEIQNRWCGNGAKLRDLLGLSEGYDIVFFLYGSLRKTESNIHRNCNMLVDIKDSVLEKEKNKKKEEVYHSEILPDVRGEKKERKYTTRTITLDRKTIGMLDEKRGGISRYRVIKALILAWIRGEIRLEFGDIVI
ncbi:MAG: hypothetical protein AB1779_00845 [Candidatus Thermoplasmatota archaeon]